MTNLIVDSSVAVKWFIPEPYSTEARKVLDEYRKGAISFLAPYLINAEVGNVIWKKHVLQGLAAADGQAVSPHSAGVSHKWSRPQCAMTRASVQYAERWYVL